MTLTLMISSSTAGFTSASTFLLQIDVLCAVFATAQQRWTTPPHVSNDMLNKVRGNDMLNKVRGSDIRGAAVDALFPPVAPARQHPELPLLSSFCSQRFSAPDAACAVVAMALISPPDARFSAIVARHDVVNIWTISHSFASPASLRGHSSVKPCKHPGCKLTFGCKTVQKQPSGATSCVAWYGLRIVHLTIISPPCPYLDP